MANEAQRLRMSVHRGWTGLLERSTLFPGIEVEGIQVDS
jgi:hypothetical protein